MWKPLVVMLAALSGLMLVSPVQAQWGSFKGQVVLDGDAPAQKLLIKKGDKAAKDPEVCAAEDVPDESLAIDAASKGIANVAVWVVKKPAKIHPDLAKPKEATVQFDQVGCKFIPHVMVVHTSQTVQVVSGDAVAHNTRGNPPKGIGFNFIVAPNDRKGNNVTLKSAERLPVQVGCDIHAWMRAYWVVLDHPYAAVTDKEGKFEIKDLPAGDHEFRIWHENPGYLAPAGQDSKKALSISIKDGQTTEFPVLKVALDKLSKK